MREEKDNLREGNECPQTEDSRFKSHKQSLEITGLGMLAALMIAPYSLVGDGTLKLSDYLVFVGFLLVSAWGLAWRLLRLASNTKER